jgi:hypothetical protein
VAETDAELAGVADLSLDEVGRYLVAVTSSAPRSLVLNKGSM